MRQINEIYTVNVRVLFTQLPNRTGANETKSRKSSGKISEDRQRDGGDYTKEIERPKKRTSQETVEKKTAFVKRLGQRRDGKTAI